MCILLFYSQFLCFVRRCDRFNPLQLFLTNRLGIDSNSLTVAIEVHEIKYTGPDCKTSGMRLSKHAVGSQMLEEVEKKSKLTPKWPESHQNS